MVWTSREREEEESRKTCICGKQGGTRSKIQGEFMNKPETKRGKEILEDRRTGGPRGQVERVDSPGSGSLNRISTDGRDKKSEAPHLTLSVQGTGCNEGTG